MHGRGYPSAALTPRQIEVLALAADGLTNKEIGERLGISEQTVGNHLINAYRVLGVETRIEALVVSGVLVKRGEDHAEAPVLHGVAASMLGVSSTTLRSIPAAELPYFQIGARKDRRYLPSDLRAYVERRMQR